MIARKRLGKYKREVAESQSFDILCIFVAYVLKYAKHRHEKSLIVP